MHMKEIGQYKYLSDFINKYLSKCPINSFLMYSVHSLEKANSISVVVLLNQLKLIYKNTPR